MSLTPPIQSKQALKKWNAEAITALFLEAQKRSNLSTCSTFLDEALSEDEWEELSTGAEEKIAELGFHHELLLTLSAEMDDAVISAKDRAEAINDFLMRQSSYGFLGYELSKKAYRMEPFTHGHAQEHLDMSDPSNRESRALYANDNEYLAMCKGIHDQTQREIKEGVDRRNEANIREQLTDNAEYRNVYYRHIAIPKEFGARGNYDTGVFELCQADDYDYLYGFDPAALNGWSAMLNHEKIPAKKPIDAEENEALTTLASQYATLKKTPATDQLIESALSLLPYLYETCSALEQCHSNPTQAHSVYLAALKKRKPTHPQGKTVTSFPFSEIKLLNTRTECPVNELLAAGAIAAAKNYRKSKRKERFEGSTKPKMTRAFWVLAIVDLLAFIGSLVYTYQSEAVFPPVVYWIGFFLTAAVFFLCARYVDCDWDWTERDWKIGILIAIGLLAIVWFGIAVDPQSLLNSLLQTRNVNS